MGSLLQHQLFAMMSKISIALLLVAIACVSSENPAANKPWHFIHKRAYVSPNTKEIPYQKVLLPPHNPKHSRIGSKSVDGCGVPVFTADNQKKLPGKDAKIVGGTEVVPHSYPWQAGLFIDFIYFCGGSLINEEYVLTAAHCLHNMTEANVILGAHNIRENEASQLSIRSNDLIVHEDYKPLVIHNDVALVHLPTAVTYTDYIMPVCLPAYSDGYLDVGTIVTPTGWGLTSDQDVSISPTLNSVDVPIYDHDLCDEYYGIVNEGIICIDSTGDHGTCEGDSGGPLNYPVNGKIVTRGIVSFGSSAGCDSGAPDAFTRVEFFLDWISANTGIAIDP